jgi:hypothetical protein
MMVFCVQYLKTVLSAIPGISAFEHATRLLKLNVNFRILFYLLKVYIMAKSNKLTEKAARKQIEKKLEITLAALGPVLGNKDFKRRIKKAGKAFTKGLKGKEREIALEHLRKLSGIKEETIIRKKTRIRNLSPQVVAPVKRKVE